MGTLMRRLLAGLLVAGLVLPAIGVPTANAAGPTFGTPKATSSYGKSVEFTVPFTASAGVERIELRLRGPDSLGPQIIQVTPPGGSGEHTLRYELQLADGGFVPNTTLSASWVAYPAGGGAGVESASVKVTYADTTEDWKVVKGDLMRVHWYDGSEAFAKRALQIGEQAVRDTSSLLGVTETAPIDFFIYADEQAFRTALGPGTRENVGGQSHADIRTLFALITPSEIDDPWVGIVIPHELTHLVFDTAVRNPYRFPPRWLNEGLAVYLSEGNGPSDQSMLAGAVAAGDLIPLTALGGQFPTEPDKTSLAYAESVSAIDYLVQTKGRDTLVGLVLGYKDGLTDDEAFQKGIGEGVSAFEAEWLASVGAKEPTRYGPQPAPPGPVPPGWDAAAPGPVAGPTAEPLPRGTAIVPSSPSRGDAGGDSVPLVIAIAALVMVIVVAGLVVARRRRPA